MVIWFSLCSFLIDFLVVFLELDLINKCDK